MLEFTQEVGDAIEIGDNIKITIAESKSGQVKLGIDAPRNIPIRREEIIRKDMKKK